MANPAACSVGPCAYCGNIAPEATFLTREHVLPSAFGKFPVDNPTTRDVCDQCNRHFGRTLDEVLAVGSFEGLFRYQHGHRPISEYRHLGSKTRYRVVGREGVWSDMHLDFIPSSDGAQLLLTVAKQLALTSASGDDSACFRVADAPTLEAMRLRFGKNVRVRVLGFASDAEARAALESVGYPRDGELSEDMSVVTDLRPVHTEISFTIDRVILRAVAKIAFNYFVSLHPSVARMARFDAIRRFIRYDEMSGNLPVTVQRVERSEGLAESARSDFHVIRLVHDAARDEVCAEISLYNQFVYRVVFGSAEFAVQMPLGWFEAEAVFDLKSRTVSVATR